MAIKNCMHYLGFGLTKSAFTKDEIKPKLKQTGYCTRKLLPVYTRDK